MGNRNGVINAKSEHCTVERGRSTIFITVFSSWSKTWTTAEQCGFHRITPPESSNMERDCLILWTIVHCFVLFVEGFQSPPHCCAVSIVPLPLRVQFNIERR